MTKKTQPNKIAKQDQLPKSVTTEKQDLDDEEPNSGFSNYLRSASGLDTLRIFVIANSLVVFLTVGWPHIKEAISIISDWYNESPESDE